MVTSRLTLEGCGLLYAECKALAPDFSLHVEVYSGGRQVVANGCVHDCLFVDQERLTGSPLGDLLALHNLLLRFHRALLDAHHSVA